ncbi:MAG: DUF4272 domain-containing protein [Oscillospiraceae bacterium]|nr:DUF4272 domain-containing protein [Oscillospiraceae bacterium]
MNSALSYFKPSAALLRENLKRFWGVPAIGMVCWFFAGIFPLLADGIVNNNWFFETIAEMHNPFFIFFSIAFPFVASGVTMRYLFSTASSSAMHTLPFTRGKLFCTSFVSSAVMSLAPAAVTFLVLSLVGGGILMLVPFALTVLLMLFYTAMFHIAAMLTGNAVLYTGVSGILAAALSGAVLLVGLYGQALLYGFTLNGVYETYAVRFTPLLYIALTSPDYEPVWLAVYILSVPVMYAIGAALYSRRRIERAGDSFTFTWFETLFTFIITFAGMTIMSLIFEASELGEFPLNLGSIVGAALCFLIARMVSRKSLRVFNRRTLVQGGSYLCVIALMLCTLVFDLTGYERRVPDARDVKSVSIVGSLSYHLFDTLEIEFTEPENIRHVTALHKMMVNDSRSRTNTGIREGDILMNFSLNYALAGGELARSWSDYITMESANESLKALFESREAKAQADILNPDLGTPAGITLDAPYGMMSSSYYGGSVTLSSDDYGEFLSALNKDIQSETWEEFISPHPDVVNVNIAYNVYDQPPSMQPPLYGQSSSGSFYSINKSIEIPPHYSNTITWLKQNGLHARLTEWQKRILSAELYDRSTANNYPWEYETLYISDVALIQSALGCGRNHLTYTDYSMHWELTVFVEVDDKNYGWHDQREYNGVMVPVTIVNISLPPDAPILKELIASAK